MPTNRSMIQVLERGADLIDELNAINKLLRLHLGQQKRQKGITDDTKYVYNKRTKRYTRVYPK